jgi:integration host factor subunit beta
MSGQEVRTTTKKELVTRISEKTGQPKAVVREVVQSFLDEIVDELALGNRLEFREFGVFEVKDRAPRRAQNPRTLQKVEVPGKRAVRFKVGRSMRLRVCDGQMPVPAPAAQEPPPPAPRVPEKPPLRKPGSPF